MQHLGLTDRQPISIGFVGFHRLFNPVWNHITMDLQQRFSLDVSEPASSGHLDVVPDILFFSVYEEPHLHPRYSNCLKVFTCEENIRTPWHECSYSLSGDYSQRSRHLRHPIYVRVLRHLPHQDCIRQGLLPGANLTLVKDPATDWRAVAARKTKFCNFVVSNGQARERIRLFELLSRYKTVDSGGWVLNNLGYRVKDKLPFISDFKFTIAYENSTYPGYVTEKIVEPMVVNSIPIYWGSPVVHDDFNTPSFVWANGRRPEDVVDEIVELDRDDDKYVAKLAQPWFRDNVPNRYCQPDYLADFFQRIVDELTSRKKT